MPRLRLLLLLSVVSVVASGAIFAGWSAGAGPDEQVAAEDAPVQVVVSPLHLPHGFALEWTGQSFQEKQ